MELNGAKILYTIHTNIPLLGDFKITQTLVSTWIVMALLSGFAIWLGHDLKLENVSKRQAAAEFIVTRLEQFVQEMDAAVRASLTPERKRRRMADQMGWVYKVDQQKAPLRIKQRVFQMGEYISGIPADFWFSYLGNPLMPNTPELAQYITDFGVWVPPDGGSLCVEASTLNGVITLCIENKVPKAGLPGILRRVLEAEGIPVLEAQALDEV